MVVVGVLSVVVRVRIVYFLGIKFGTEGEEELAKQEDNPKDNGGDNGRLNDGRGAHICAGGTV